MGNVGIKVSQPNYPVESAEDYKLLFSSSWPNLSIVASGRYTTNNATTTVHTHNLGYVPMYLLWELSGASLSFVNKYGGLFEVNDTELREKGPNGLGGRTFFYQIYAVDINIDFDASDIILGQADDIESSIDRNFGIKVSKPGKDIFSTDFRDYVIHSRTRSPMVGKIKQFDSSNSATITHNYGYAPMAYMYGNKVNSLDSGYFTFYEISPESSTGWSLSTNATAVNIAKSGAADNVRIVVLKDPMIAV